ncbi:AAA family ATPase [Vibrio cholerae]|uniref:McrB family protein n=1 Tax=Vibrio cholerae TaxID=666 RepID=UPI000A1F7F66|nr:AAA family ATPase [Vibrio cholerae]EJL6360357.1 AAA family ATPase [Vibrio cholerae]OSP48020.1 AAA family ATPase [Vibrio cholerae]TQP80028.1 AAA family ATPase [Vibrio cholerae]
MTQADSLQALWDEFLATWPLDRIETMTLPEYVSTQDKTTFTYWLETRTQPLANIKGSPSPKFGIYKRNSDPKDRSGMIHGDEYSWWEKFGATEQEAFEKIRNEIIKVIKAARDGDVKSIDKVELAPIYKWKIAFMYQDQNAPCIINIFAKDKLVELTGLPSSSGYPELYHSLMQDYSVTRHDNIAEYGRVCWSRLDNEKTESVGPMDGDDSNNTEERMNLAPLNQILYGPPGTGKTYHTIEAAVKAAEPSFSWDSREELKAEYDRLVSDKRIRFVTFHQSYGYEEFVEGLRAVSNQDNQIEYLIQSGIFKQICQDATASAMNQPATLKPNAKIWKLSIDGVKSSRVRDYCFENNLAAIGWGDTGDMSSEERSAEEQDYFESLGALAKSSIMEFSNRMAEGDIVVCVKGQWSIQAVGVVSGEYQFREEGVEGRSGFCHVIPVDWLATGLDVNLYELNDNTRLTLKTCYELTRFTPIELYEVLDKSGVKLNRGEQAESKKQNYVLIIDEINRGNISKVFGELITLIEPSKRKGQDEALELALPYSGKPFSVPDNLYIIGTMNTADRSLAMMDTALRRRFDFVEMMPNPTVLRGAVVEGINLETLLKTLNERIEILYDREHTLGHAFFMPVKALLDENKEEEAFAKLVSVFQNKVIPLLQEYFFEDWHKIRLVLGDNQRGERLQFIGETTLDESKLNALFGAEHELDHYGDASKRYELKPFTDEVWRQPETYIGIYSPKKEQ